MGGTCWPAVVVLFELEKVVKSHSTQESAQVLDSAMVLGGHKSGNCACEMVAVANSKIVASRILIIFNRLSFLMKQKWLLW
ncbi:MAG TPA: hypothetical protein PK198_04265, partial [Saprospiraceae bacterium]|nr:hypothetical protein [Saprospiraceae bacterium]